MSEETEDQDNKGEALLVTKELFTEIVALIYRDQKEGSKSYIDAIVSTCEELEIDVEDSKNFMSKALVSTLESEAIDLNLLKNKIKVVKLF